MISYSQLTPGAKVTFGGYHPLSPLKSAYAHTAPITHCLYGMNRQGAKYMVIT